MQIVLLTINQHHSSSRFLRTPGPASAPLCRLARIKGDILRKKRFTTGVKANLSKDRFEILHTNWQEQIQPLGTPSSERLDEKNWHKKEDLGSGVRVETFQLRYS